MSGQKRSVKLDWRVFGVIGLIVLVAILLTRGSKDEFSYLHAKASELEFDRDRIVAFVQDEVSEEDYPGSPRGALGTLWGMAGNREDRARLLQGLLAEAEQKGELVGSGEDRAVKLADSGEVIGLGDEVAGDWTPVESGSDFSIRFSGANAEELFEGRVSEFLRSPLRVSVDGGTARVINRSGVAVWKGDYDSADGFSMHLAFSMGDQEPVRVWRELVAAGSATESSSEHVVVFAPCEIGKGIFEKQAELVAADWGDAGGVAEAHQLALAHWYRSDQALADLESFHEADAWYAVPRVLIGSVYSSEGEDEPTGYALDLRLNEIHIEADDESRLAFALTRAALEADLEARVMMEATGRRSRSGIDVMLAQLGDWAPSSVRRISDYEKTLAGFLRDTHPGSLLVFSVGEDLQVSLTRLDGENALGIELSEGLEARRKEITELPWEVMTSDKVPAGRFADFSVELETLLGAASAVGFDYRPGIEIGHSPALIKSPHVRRFQYTWDEEAEKSRVAFEQQIVELREDGSYVYDVIDYRDEVNERWQVNRTRYHVPAETYHNGAAISQWHSPTTIPRGCNPFALSQKVYRELKEEGSTEVVAYLYDNNATDPIRLQVMAEGKFPIIINQKRIMVSALWIGGRPVGEELGTEEWNDLKLMDDPKTPYPDGFNRFIAIDDPEMPLIVRFGEFYQAAISGKVRIEGDDTPVGDAEIRVAEAGVTARSWPTGDFVLPIIKKPFDEFTVTVTHPDFEPWSETFDFRLLETFGKLGEIRLTPRPPTDRFAWIQPETLEADLAKVSDENMARFVRQSLADDPSLQALVPLNEVPIGFDSDAAWLLLDRDTGHMTAVTSEGLHGAVGSVGGQAAGELQGGAISAYSGYIASWYAYAGGKLDAITEAMGGGDFSDLGHAHAKAFAMRFLERMMAATDNVFASQAGVNSEAYKAGFLKGLAFFDEHPEYRGE